MAYGHPNLYAHKKNNHLQIPLIMTYDEKIKNAEEIIVQLEQAEAIGMDEYKRRAAEATALLEECKKELKKDL